LGTGKISARARDQGGQPGNKVHWLEQYLCRAVAKGALEFENHQVVYVDRQSLQGNRVTCHVSALPLEFGPLVGLAGHRGVDGDPFYREPIPVQSPGSISDAGTSRYQIRAHSAPRRWPRSGGAALFCIAYHDVGAPIVEHTALQKEDAPGEVLPG